MCQHQQRRSQLQYAWLKDDMAMVDPITNSKACCICNCHQQQPLPVKSFHQWLSFILVALCAGTASTFAPVIWSSWNSERQKVLVVLGYTTAGALAAGVGCLPLFLLKNIDAYAQGVSAAVASGVMAMASIELLWESVSCAVDYNVYLSLLGCFLGVLLVGLTDKLVDNFNISIGDLNGASARRAIVVLGVMTLHSFAEGIGIGVSFSGVTGERLGRFIAVAIGLHNIPEGMAIGLTMVPRGESVWRATLYSVLSSLPQPLLSIPAFLLVEQFQLFLPIGLGLAAGAMMWLVLCELVPESLEHISIPRFFSLFSMSMSTMWALGHALHFLQEHS